MAGGFQLLVEAADICPLILSGKGQSIGGPGGGLALCEADGGVEIAELFLDVFDFVGQIRDDLLGDESLLAVD